MIWGGDTAMGSGDAALGGGDADVDSWDFCLFFQRRRAGGESGGGISNYRGIHTLYCVRVFLLTLKMMNNYKLYYNLGF